jgi:16S rRNA (cytidine1402-2'-O)-methyltransferase
VPRLFLVACPIGDDDDLSPRARRVLATAAGILAEDTRVTEALLRRLGLWPRPLRSCHDHNERGRAAQLAALFAEGDQALVSDAGTPLVSDPGYAIVQAALEVGADVVPVPGPSAVLAALVASGQPTDAFRFCGFLPRESGPRAAAVAALAWEPATLVFYEAPHRLVDTLGALAEGLGERPAALAFELTKTWERWHRGALSAVRDDLIADPDRVRGEATLVVGGCSQDPAERFARPLLDAASVLGAAGVAPSLVRDALAPLGASRRALYQAALAARPRSEP